MTSTPLLNELSAETGIGPLDLRRILLRAPNRYKVYPITKRNGGVRIIAQPAREVKLVQRALASVLLEKLPIHSAATAYRKGASILCNAKPHASNGPLLKLDFKDFFPSIRAYDWHEYCRKTGCLTESDDIFLTSNLLFRHDKTHRGLRLAIGAPSSPILSNILLHEFDSRISEILAKGNVVYTRYADDMAFSAPRTGYLNEVRSSVVKVLKELNSPRLQLNEHKTTYVTKKFGRRVTGLTLSNDGRVTIGRSRKRLVSAMMHHALLGKLDDGGWQILAGTLAFINAVEPGFLETLRKKYGEEIVRKAQRCVRLKSKLRRHKPPLAPSQIA